MTDAFAVVDPEEVPREQFQTCETAVKKLTEPLGATELRVNQVLVEPGEVTTPHTHDRQEELFVAVTEGQISIEGTVYDVSAGSLVRVREDTVRNLLNQTEETTHVWFAVGAPPVGSVDDFGAYTVQESGERSTGGDEENDASGETPGHTSG